jgi:hypothetical protein
MDFKELKERVKIVEVLLHYNVRLRCRVGSEYACTACPLPTHPANDRGNNCFCVHLPTNRWQCKHPACKNGVGDKWGDCINLVVCLDRKGFGAAGKQLEEWFPQEKAAPRNGERQVQEAPKSPSHHISDDTSSPDKGKYYMREARVRMEALLFFIEDETIRKQVIKEVMAEIYQSYMNAKTARV